MDFAVTTSGIDADDRTYDPTHSITPDRPYSNGVDGPKPCDRVRKGDLIRLDRATRKVRVVETDKHGHIRCIWAVKLKRSGFPAPHTHIPRSRLTGGVDIVRRCVPLRSTDLETRLQDALDLHALTLVERGLGETIHARSAVTQDEVVGVLQ